MLLANDVVDVMRLNRIVFMQQAILTPKMGALGNRKPLRRCNGLSHPPTLPTAVVPLPSP